MKLYLDIEFTPPKKEKKNVFLSSFSPFVIRFIGFLWLFLWTYKIINFHTNENFNHLTGHHFELRCKIVAIEGGKKS